MGEEGALIVVLFQLSIIESRCCPQVGEEDALIVVLFQLSIIESHNVVHEWVKKILFCWFDLTLDDREFNHCLRAGEEDDILLV